MSGKADGITALLPADELQRIDDRLTAAIAAADAQIASLEAQIAKGQNDLWAKQSQINDLVNQISNRQAQVQQNYNNSVNIGILGAFFGLPLVTAASLVQAYDQDSLLQSLNSQLATAKSQRDSINQQIATYKQKRDAITAQLAPLKDRYKELKGLLTSPPALTVDAPDGVQIGNWHDATAERARITALGKVLDNANLQVGLLQKLLALVSSVNAQVDQAVATLKELAKAADAEAKKSDELFQSLLKIALSGDPNAAAEDWLNDELARRTRAALKSLDWPAKTFVEALLDGASDDELAARLLEALTTGAGTTTGTGTGTGSGSASTSMVMLAVDHTSYAVGTTITVSWKNGPGTKLDWIGVFDRGDDLWASNDFWGYYLAPSTKAAPKSGTLQFSGAEHIPAGQYTAYYFPADGEAPIAAVDFDVK